MTSTQTFYKITYNTIILARGAIQFLDLNFSISRKFSRAFLDFILSLAKAQDKIKLKNAMNLRDIEKISVQNFITLRTKITVL